MSRHGTVSALLLATLLLAGCGSAARKPAHDLTGTWINSAPPGTTLELTQHGSALTWVGGPNSKVWVQYFNGKVSGNAFSGTFRQDAPTIEPQRFHGEMQARIDDGCHFTFTKIAQAGTPTVSDVEFTKSTCAAGPQIATRLAITLDRGGFTPAASTTTCPSVNRCVVANGALVTFCNWAAATHSLATSAKGNAFTVPALKQGTCFTTRLVNPGTTPLKVRVHDGPPGQQLFVLRVQPTKP